MASGLGTAVKGRLIAPEDLRADGNTFAAWRWTLSLLVIFSHAWDLTQPVPDLDPTVPWLTVPVSHIAVDLFFSLSGFLVAGSLVKRGLKDYGISRALRILPGLWVMLLVTTIGLGIAFGTLPLREYFTNPETWRYLWRNAALLGQWYSLPGVFETHPFPVTNGSLWTIRHEVRCYIALALVGSLGLLVARQRFTVLLVLGALLHFAVPLDAIPALEEPRRLAFAFFAGVLFYVWRDRVRLSWPLAVAAAVLGIAFAHLPLPDALRLAPMQVGTAYFMFVAAFAAPAAQKRFSAAMPDYSFGIYIYGVPAQQVAISLGLGLTPLTNLFWGIAITLPFAALSWHFIESPALNLKSTLMRSRRVTAAAAG